MTRPTVAARSSVVERAGNRCEYCLIHQDDAASVHQVDHIISEKHGGETTLGNLALSCLACNRRKGSDIGAIDRDTGRLVPLYNPRSQSWRRQFQFIGPRIVGRTAVGRATVRFLQFNLPERLRERGERGRSADGN